MVLGLIYSNNTIYKLQFKTLIYWFTVGILINIVLMKYYNGSSSYDVFFVLINYFGLLIYFFLHKNNYSKELIVKVFLGFAVIVSFLMIAQQIVRPTPLFNQLERHIWFLYQRGTARVRIPGMALVVFSYFYYLNKFLNKFRVKYIVVAAFFLAVILLQGFRSITLSMLLCSLYLYWLSGDGKRKITIKKILLLLMVSLVVVVVVTQIPFLNSIVEEMLLQSSVDQKIGDNNIRLFGFKYFLDTIKDQSWMYLTGNGLKLPIEPPLGLFAVDLGLFGFYALAGIIPTIALVLFFIKGIILGKKGEDLAVKTFFVYMFMNCFLFNAEPFRVGIFHIYGIMFYLLDSNFKKKKI